MKKLYITILIASLSATVFAQTDRQCIRRGNAFFHKQDYAKAEAEYIKALKANKDNAVASYNLGCSYMMQEKDSLAVEAFNDAGEKETSKTRKAMAYHNIGVVMQNHKDYGQAITAYKEALRNNPNDDETRYNLALCQKLKKDGDGGGGNDNQQNQDQKQNQQNQDQNKQDKDEQQKQQEQQKQDEQMSKENAEQLLNAATQQEKSTQQRVKEAQNQTRPRRLEKNW